MDNDLIHYYLPMDGSLISLSVKDCSISRSDIINKQPDSINVTPGLDSLTQSVHFSES